MTVGSLGNIIFEVSSSKVKTLKSLKRSGSVSYGKHQRHCGSTLLEFTGKDADALTFNMTLSASLGIDVEAELKKIETAERTGKAMRFILGKSIVGSKWVITKHTISYEYFDKEQKPMLAEVSLSLTEYLSDYGN